MSRIQGTAVALAAVLLCAVGCQQKAVGPTAEEYDARREKLLARQQLRKGAGTPKAKGAPTQEASEDSGPVWMGSNEGYFYDAIGKRDPFRSFILERRGETDSGAKGPLEQFDLSQLEISAVVWEGARRRAFVLDPSGQGYIVSEGDRIGKNDGHVIGIGDSTMLVREAYVDFHGEKTTKEIEMRIRQSQGG